MLSRRARWTAVLLLISHSARAYIPALPVNDTSGIIRSNSTLTVAWTNGLFSADLSRQLIADPVDAYGNYVNGSEEVTEIEPWTKYSKGVLVHFSEANTTEAPSGVPWIGMVSCDTNGTTYSLQDDIFTLLRDHGAQAALLYSLTSQGCLMNQDYLQNFEKPIDVYTTTDLQSARLIENQFTNVNPSAYSFDSATLNASATAINALLSAPALAIVGNVVMTVEPSAETLPPSDVDSSTSYAPLSFVPTAPPTVTTTSLEQGGDLSSASASSPTSVASSSSLQRRADYVKRQQVSGTAVPTSVITSLAPSATVGANYLAAVMASANMTVGGSTNTSSGAAATATGSGNGSPNTGLAMIILYAITGVVTFMFLIVILSGAIRAIRHPERYGPRAAANGPYPGRSQQSRAHGLTRAILDTFPVVKFGRSTEEVAPGTGPDVEAGKDLEMDERPAVVALGTETAAAGEEAAESASRADRRVSGSSTGQGSFVSATELPHAVASISDSEDAPRTASPSGTTLPTPTPATINPANVDDDTTCPICVCEFEEGEDVRILPCDGRHRFHRDCIDPWLLQVSSLCPLCRLDLAAGKEEVPVSSAQEEQEAEAIGEQQVISNLREMLRGRRGSTSVGGGGPSTTAAITGGAVAGGTVGSRNKFFRYVASKRRQAVSHQEGALVAGPSTSASTST